MRNTGQTFQAVIRSAGSLLFILGVFLLFGMLAGRLEIIPVLLLFSRRAWRS